MAGLGTGAPIVKVYHERSMILPDVSRVLACLYEKEIPFERETFSSYSSLLRLQASSRVPVPFYDGPNKFLEESREICHHIAETYEDQGYPFLLGKDSLERASIEEWLHHEEHNFNPPSRSLFCHLAFPVVEEDDDIDLQTRKLEEVLEVYEQRLGDSQFLAGNKFTLADLVHLPNSHHITNSDKFLYLYDSRKNVQRWWHEISRRGSWQKVLKIMHEVELQNKQELDKQRQRKQEELEKQQRRQWQKQHPPTSRPQFRLDPREQPSTKPHTILVPPPVSIIPASPTTPQAEEPHAIKTSPDEAPVSSSLSIPTTHKPSDVRSKHTTISTTHEETPPAFVQSTPRIPEKSPIPVERRINFFTPATSPTTAEKPSRTGADKSRIRDASLHSEAAEIDLPTKSKPSSSKKASDNLHDFYEASIHTDEAEPYAESTSPKPSEMLDEKSETDGHKNAVDHAESSPRSAKEDSDRLRASGFWTDNRAPNADTQDKNSVRYTERIPQRPVGNISGRATDQRVTYTSPGKPRSREAHQKLQSEQWHATAGLSNLKGETDDLMPPTQQAKPSKDVQDISSQDSEPTSTRPLAQEPVSMDAQLAEGPERATRTPDTDQRRDVSSMLWQQGAAVRPPYARKDAAEARRFPADRRKDASLPKRLRDDTRAIPLYDDDDDDDDTNQEARETASAPRRTRAQDPYDSSEGTSSRSQPVSPPHDAVPPPKQATSEGPYARKDAVEARRFRADHRKDTPLPKRVRDDIQAIPLYDDDDTNQEARETASAPRRTRARDPYDTSEGISSRSQPVNAPHDAVPPPKQETPEGPYAREDVVEARRFPADRGKDAPLPKRVRGDTQAIPLYDDDDDTNQETRETASAPRRTRAGDPYDTSEGISSRSQPANAPHDAVPQTKQTTPEGPYARKDVVESRRFPADRKKDAPLPKRVRDDTQAIPLYGDDHDSNQETRETASAPRRTRAQDPYDTSEGIGIYHSSSSRPEPVNAPHDPVPLPNQAASEGSRRATAPYPAAQEVFKQARKSPTSRSIVPHDAQRSTEEETMESSSSKAHPLDSHLADAHPPKQYLDEDGYGAITPLQTGYTGDPYNRKQDRGVAAPKRMMSQDDFEETKMTDSASLEAQTPDHRQADAPPQRQQPTEDPQTSASPSRIRYSDDEDTAKQAKHAHQKLQSEQWHAATTGLSNLKGETDDFVPPTQQAKPSKDVQHISPQDAEQANTRPLAQEPVGMDGQLVQGPERTARTPHTDQRRDVNSMLWQRPANVQGIAESDRTSSDHGGAVRPPYARKDAAEARIVPADRRKDASFPKHAPNDTQAVPLYEDDHDTSQEARETASAPRRTTAPQDPVPPPKQAAFEGPRRATTPYPAAREIIKQARKSPASRSIVPHDAQGSTEEEETLEETEFVEPASSRAQPVDYKRTDTPSRKREGVKDPLGATSPVERKYADGKDTTKHSAFKPRNVVGQDAEDTSEEAEARNSALFRRPSPDSWSAAATPSKEAAAEDALRVSQSPPTRYPRAEETSKASASIPTDIAAQDARDVFRGSKVADSTPLQNKYPDAKDAAKKSKVTFEETKISDSAPSRGKPLDSQRVDGPSWKKEATEDPRATSPVKKRRSDVEDTTKQSRDNGFKPRQIVGQHAQGTYKETKASDPVLYTWQAATTPTEKIATEDGPSVTPPSKRRSPSDEDSIKQSRGTAPAPRRTTSHDANVTFQDSKPAESMSSGEQPLRSRQEVEDSRSKTSAFDKTIPYVEDSTSQALDTVFGPNQPADSRSPTKVERTPSVYEQDHLVAQDSHKQPETLPTSGRADGSILKHQQDPVVPSIPEEKSSTPSTLPRARIRDDHPTEEPFKGDNVDDRKGAPPLLGQEPASQVQRATELPQEAAPDGELSTIDQWRHTSVPLQGDDVLGGSTIDQKPPPMSEQSIPSARGANEMVKKEKRMVPPARTGAQTPDVQRAPSSFSGTDTAERDGEQVQMQAPTLHARPTSVPTRIATPDARDTSDQEFANKSDAQRWNALKAKHDLAMTGEDYRNASPSTHDATVDNKTALPASEAQGSDTWPGSTANPVNAQPTSDDARVGRFSRDQGAQPPESTQAQTHFDAPRASVSTPDVPRDTLDKTKSSKQTSTEGMTPTAATPTSKAQFAKQKFTPSDKKLARAAPESSKEDTSFSAPEKPQTIFRQEARPSAAITKQVPSPDAHHDTRKIQHVTLANFPPDDSPIPDQDSIQSAQQSSSSGTSKETIVAAAGPTLPATVGKDTQDSHEQPQTLPIVGKADGSTPKRQQDPEEKSSTPPAPPRARVRDGHTTEEPFKGGIVDDRKRAPPLLGQEPTSQVQRATELSQEAAPDGELSTIDKWQRTSVPLQGDDVLGGSTIEQRPTPMSQQSIPGARGASEVVEKEQRMAPPARPGAQTPNVLSAPSSFSAAVTAERDGEPVQMQAPTLHDQGAKPPESTQAQSPFDAPYDSVSTRDVPTDALDKTNVSKPTSTEGKAPAPTSQAQLAGEKFAPSDKKLARAARPTSTEGMAPIAGPAPTSQAQLSEQKFTPSDKKPEKPQIIFRQEVRPSMPITKQVPSSDAHHDTGKIQQVNLDNFPTDDSSMPQAPEPGTKDSPASNTQIAKARVQETVPDNYRTDELTVPSVSNEKQGSYAGSSTEPHEGSSPDAHGAADDEEITKYPSRQAPVLEYRTAADSYVRPTSVSEVFPAIKKSAPSDQDSIQSAKQPSPAETKKEETIVAAAEPTLPIIVGKDTEGMRGAPTLDYEPTEENRADIPERKSAPSDRDSASSTQSRSSDEPMDRELNYPSSAKPHSSATPDQTRDSQPTISEQAPAPGTSEYPSSGTHHTSEIFQEVAPDDHHIVTSIPGEGQVYRTEPDFELSEGPDPYSRSVIGEKTMIPPSSQAQSSDSKPNPTQNHGDEPSTRSLPNQVAKQHAEAQVPPPLVRPSDTKSTQDITSDTSGKAKSLKPPSIHQEATGSALTPDTHLGSAPVEVARPDQDPANSTQKSSSSEPHKEQSTVAAPNQAKASQATSEVASSVDQSMAPSEPLPVESTVAEAEESKVSRPVIAQRDIRHEPNISEPVLDDDRNKEPVSREEQDQRASEPREAPPPDGELSTIDKWQRTSVPLQGDDVLGGSTIEQRPTPMSQQSIPGARGASEVVEKEQRMAPPARPGAQTPNVLSAPSSFSAADTAERDGEPVQMQAPTLHDQGAKPPESTQAQSPFDAPYDSVSTRDVPTDALDKTNVSKPTSTEGKAPAPTSKAQLAGEKFAPSDKKLARAARPTSTEGMAPIAGPAPTSQAQLSEQKFTPSDKKPEKPQTIFRQEVRPSTSITKQVPSSDAHHDTRKIQQVNLDNFPIDDSSMPQAPEPGTKDSPASNTQIAKARVQETVPDNYRTDELTVPSVSNEEQGSYAGSSTEPHEGSSPDAHGAADDEEITKYPSRQAPVLEYRTAADSYVRPTSVSEVFPAIKKSAPSDQDSIQSAKQPSPAETKKEETIVAAAEWGITPTPDKQRIPDLRGAVDEKTSLQSNQAQNTDIMPDSAPIGGDVHRISGDEPATSSVRDSQARPPAGTQKVPAGFMEKTKSRRPPSTDQESMASPAPAPAPDAPQDQDSDRSSQFSPSVVSRKDVANADQTNVSQAGLRELPSSNAKLPSEEIQESSPDAYLTKSEKPLPMKDPVWPPHEASFDLSSGGKPTMIKGDQASTISDVSPSASKEGGQSEDSAVKGPLSAELVSSSPEEKWNRQQQTDQSSTRSSKDNNIEASGTRNPSTSIIPRNIQPSPLKESMQVVEGSRNQQQGDQAVFQSKQDNKTQTEETDARDTASDKPEVVRPDSAPTSGDAHRTSGDGPATSSLRRSPITDQELVTPLTSPAPAPDAPQDEDSTPPQLPPVVSRRDIANTDQTDVSPAGLRETARSVATPPSEKIQEFSPDASLTKSAKPLLPMTGTYPVQPLHEASVDLSSDGKPTMIKGDQANTISNVSLSTSQAVGQSENSAVKGPPSDDSVSSSPQKNLERTSPEEKPKQQRQSSTRPSKDDSIEASATASPNILTTSGDIQSSPLNQPSPIRENIQAAEMFRNQQQADQDVLQPRQDNRKRIEETEAQDTSTDYPEDTNGASQRAALEQQQGKNVGRVQRQSNDTNNSYEPTKDASSIIQADNKPESSSRTPEEPKQQVQREGKNQDGEAKVPASETGQPEESPNKKGITNQSQSETIDKLEDQTSSPTPNRYTNPSRSDGSTSGTKSTDTNDNDPLL